VLTFLTVLDYRLSSESNTKAVCFSDDIFRYNVNVNTSNVMGVALIGFGVGLALLVGASGGRNAIALGFIGSASLVYMGIGLYSRGNTETGLLRDSDETTKRATLHRTASYIAGAAAVGALVLFGTVTAQEGGVATRVFFAAIFLYTLPVSYRLWKMSKETDLSEVSRPSEDEEEKRPQPAESD